MVGKVEKRRAELRKSLIEIAERDITENGLRALRARDLAAEAGCAVGAIYNVFGDLTDLTLAVNARTFKRMGAHIAAQVANAGDAPSEQLTVMAHAYLDFAAANHNVWRALFDIERAADEVAPEWYLVEMGQLLAIIDAPLTRVFPDLPATDRALMTRALFSSVHGIVLLGLDQASAGVPTDQLRRMIALVLQAVTSSN
jgi:AcrR family transcriptional regulator